MHYYRAGQQYCIIMSRKYQQQKEQPQEPIEQNQSGAESQSSSSESQDSNAELINDSITNNFLSALVRIKAHDSQLYSLKNPLFKEEDFDPISNKATKEDQKLTYKDMQRQMILEGKGMEVEEPDSQDDSERKRNSKKEETPAEEKRRLKDSFKKAFIGQEEQQEQIFKVKKKTPADLGKQTQEYNTVLQKLARNKSQQELYKKMWGTDKELDANEDFLRKYILQKGWIDPDQGKQRIGKTAELIDENDEKMSEEVDQFQASYNFRYQQPGSDLLQTFPRHLDETLRQKKKQTRSQKRKRREEQKKKLFQEEMKEVQRQKEQKKTQIADRIHELKQKDEMQNIEMEVEENQEWDGDQWFYCDDCERGLKEQETYFECKECDSYNLCQECNQLIIHKHKLGERVVEEGCGAPDDEEVKRVLAELLRCKKCKLVLDDFDNYFECNDEKAKLTYYYCNECQDLLPLSLRKRCTSIKQKKVNLSQALENNPEILRELTLDQEVDRLIEEYNALEQVQGVDGKPLKCKFKYMQVKPQSFGLSDQQILFSDDKQLQKYVSITRLRPYIDKDPKVRTSIYKKKIGSIQKSAQVNKMEAQEENALRKLQKKKRLQGLEKRVERREALLKKKKEKVRVVDLSTKDKEIGHFVSKDRLASYTL